MRNRGDVQTVADPRGGWINKRDGAQVGVVYDSEEAAVIAGRVLARESRGEHIVQAMDGSIRMVPLN